MLRHGKCYIACGILLFLFSLKGSIYYWTLIFTHNSDTVFHILLFIDQAVFPFFGGLCIMIGILQLINQRNASWF